MEEPMTESANVFSLLVVFKMLRGRANLEPPYLIRSLAQKEHSKRTRTSGNEGF